MTRRLPILTLLPLTAWLLLPTQHLAAAGEPPPPSDDERLIAVTIDDLPVNGADRRPRRASNR